MSVIEHDLSNVGFIGLGTMGAPIARRLIAPDRRLFVSDAAVPSAGAWDQEDGCAFVEDAAEIAAACRVVFLSLPGPAEVEDVVSRLMVRARPGAIIVDLSTNAHGSVIKLAGECARSEVAFVDAPVSGGVAGAIRGKLAVMAGGDGDAIARLTPLFHCFAAKVFHVGPSGMGTIAKLVNNQIFLSAAVAVQEGFVLAAKAGLDASLLLSILRASSAAPYVGLAPLFFDRDFDNATFKLRIATKDLAVAAVSARDLAVPMPVTEAALGLYQSAVEEGFGEQVFFATLQTLESEAKAQVAKLEVNT